MKAIYFIEIEGVKYYKTDTFWSKSKDFKHAKIHSDSNNDQERFFDPLIYQLKPRQKPEHDEDEWNKLQKWIGSLYGFQRVIKDDESNGWTLSEHALLSEPVYLRIIDTISKSGIVESIDAKVVMRDKLIDDIIKN